MKRDGGAISLELTGTEKVRDAMQKLGKQYPEALAGAIYKLGVAIISDALPKTPVEFGALRASHYVAPPVGKAADSAVELGFGTVYAVPQHERTDYQHPRGGQAKYLESAVQSLEPRALELLARWAEQLVASGGGWGAISGFPTHPRLGGAPRSTVPQQRRLARAARNVKQRTGR